jgi:flavin-binding protein dodecin
MAHDVPRAVVKVIELVGSSPESFSDAVRNAVSIVSQSVRNITGVEVLGSNADVEGGEITVYKVNCKIAFLVEAGEVAEAGQSGQSGADPGRGAVTPQQSAAGAGSGVPGPTAHGPGGGPMPVA